MTTTRRKSTTTSLAEWDDYCYRCYGVGELVLCGLRNCPKSYHLECLGIDSKLDGKWTCPWHICLVCGKSAVAFCIHCPNAYCKVHAQGAFVTDPILGNICNEHSDEYKTLLEFYDMTANGVSNLCKNGNNNSKSGLLFKSPINKSERSIHESQCIHPMCQWLGLFSELSDHYAVTHKAKFPFGEYIPRQIAEVWSCEKCPFVDRYRCNIRRHVDRWRHSAYIYDKDGLINRIVGSAADAAAEKRKSSTIQLKRKMRRVSLKNSSHKEIILDPEPFMKKDVISAPGNVKYEPQPFCNFDINGLIDEDDNDVGDNNFETYISFKIL